MTTKYVKGNRYSVRVSIADAALEWQGLTLEHMDLVLLGDDGLPTHSSYPDLRERAEGLLIAVRHGQIKGFVHNEDGDYFHPTHMKLDRESVAAWIEKTDKRLELGKPVPMIDTEVHSIGLLEKLLTKDEVCVALNVSKATLDRLRSKGKFSEPTHTNPNRWLASIVAAHITATVINTASNNLPQASTDEEDI